MQNNTHALSNRSWDRLLKLTQMLVLVALVRSDRCTTRVRAVC